MTKELTHEMVEEEKRESLEWPQFFVTGKDEASDEFQPAYWKVDGPNGPVSYRNPNSGPYPATMFDLVSEHNISFEWVEKEETPWDEGSESVCDWCDDPAKYNKEIYYACESHRSELTELVDDE